MQSSKKLAVLFSAGLMVVAASWVASQGRSVVADDVQQVNTTSYRSPICLTIAPDGKTAYATDHTAGKAVALTLEQKTTRGQIALRGKPHGAALSATGDRLFVAENEAGTVAVIDTISWQVTSRIPVGKWPTSIALGHATKRLYVCNQDSHTVSVVDLSARPARSLEQIAVIREPSCAAVSTDERYVVVANQLPLGAGTDPTLAADISIIDAVNMRVWKTIRLPAGSTLVQGVCLSPEGNWAYVVHALGRFNLPITQLERGWVNTHALSIIDLAKGCLRATLLLDQLHQGAANPHSVLCSKDGTRLWISHTGVHEISLIDISRVHQLLAGNLPDDLLDRAEGTQPNIWQQIRQDPASIADLKDDLTALYIAGVLQRVPSGGIGPRGMVLTPDETKLLVANYYSGTATILDARNGELLSTIPLGVQPEADAIRRGEIIFHDARHAFQRWHSCASCHPNQGRVDALRWDFLRDGIGNAKDTPSLVLVDQTAPLNRRATRKDARECAHSGMLVSHMTVPTEKVVEDLLAYLVSLRPRPNPHRTNEGALTAAAQRGKTLFHGRANCAGCHPAPYFTDKKMHNLGVLSQNDPDGRYDTPSLVEVFRTAPYLHDGRALTLDQVFTDHNEQGRHGNTHKLSAAELDDLVAYLRSL